MGWRHIEDSEETHGTFQGASTDDGFKRISTSTIPLSVFRCGSCNALAVVRKGDTPYGACGKCGAK